MNSSLLQKPLQFLKGVGPRRASDLSENNLHVLEDLLLHLPLRYEDRGDVRLVNELKPNEIATVSGEVLSCGLRRTRRRNFNVLEMLLKDDSGQMRVVFFNQPFLKDVFKVHEIVVIHGKVTQDPKGGIHFSNPQYELVGSKRSERKELVHTGRIVPVYERIGCVTPKMLRRIIFHAVRTLPDKIDDPLPAWVRKEFNLTDRRHALVCVHCPESVSDIDELNRFRSPAHRRLIFEEFFLFQLGLALRCKDSDSIRKPQKIRVTDRIREAALAVLPFRLTNDQKNALRDVIGDLKRPQPMNRLLQGDVGSGKTIVALLAALVAMENELQVAVMSPTELLAEQHFLNLSRLLGPSRFEPIRLTGHMSSKERSEMSSRLSTGQSRLVVGTHALVQESVEFKALGLVIIDEQHRFGVVQRANLRAKGMAPDVLVMTATPIPRTLALTAYGDLDVSVIRELPPGRVPVKTIVRNEEMRDDIYSFVDSQLSKGRQAYLVYPLVEESSKLDLRSATEMANYLGAEVFPHRKLALLHGRMKSDERVEVMRKFASNDLDVLVATTVVEVGIDVPNATVMVVEHAERFGLAQLHQLRGRVGRGSQASQCILVYHEPLSTLARARLDAMSDTIDGFELSERDLELRGPGDVFGTRQHGVPFLRVGDLLRDQQLMVDAKRAAFEWLSVGRPSRSTVMIMLRDWSERFGLAGIG